MIAHTFIVKKSVELFNEKFIKKIKKKFKKGLIYLFYYGII